MLLDPATGNSFFGRHDILSLLKKRADGLRSGYRQNVCIIGPSHCGKTSLAYRFITSLDHKSLVPVYVEAKDKGLGEFIEKFTSTLVFKYQEHIDKMPRTVKAVKLAESFMKSGKSGKAFRAVLEIPAVAYSEAGLKPIVILDEFDRLGTFGIEDVFAELGKFIMVQKDTMYIVTSSRIKQARDILSQKLSLLFGNFEVCELGTFDEKEACGFIDSRLDRGGLPPELREFIAVFTGGHPFYMDSILVNLEKYNSDPSDACFKDKLLDTFTGILFDSKGILNQHFCSVITELEKADRRFTSVLLALSAGARKHVEISSESRISGKEAAALLETLMDLGRVSKHGAYYLIRDKVFGFWLKNVYQSKEYLFDAGYEPKISRFRDSVSGSIDSFAGECRNPKIKVVAELFMSFKGDLIEISDKSLRIPPFKSYRINDSGTDRVGYITLSDGKSDWIVLFGSAFLGDADIIDYLGYCKKAKSTLKRKIILTASGVGVNARLIAKDAKCLIWGSNEFNTLADIAGKQRILLPVSGEEKAEAALSDIIGLETA
jgi:AAA+ ATPase superfamily predicted ATPase